MTEEIIEVQSDPVEKEPIKEKATISTSESGALVAKDIDDLWRIATMALKSGFVPKSYTKPEQIVVAMQFAVGLGLPPTVASLTNIAVINNQPSIFGDLPLKLVQESGKLEYIDEYLIDKEYNKISVDNKNLEAEPWAAVCEVQRKDFPRKKVYWTMDQQNKTNNRNPVWKNYPDIMLKRKARTIALKDDFSDVLGPVPIAEYHHEQAPDMGFKDVTPRNQEASAINQMFWGDRGKESGRSEQDNNG